VTIVLDDKTQSLSTRSVVFVRSVLNVLRRTSQTTLRMMDFIVIIILKLKQVYVERFKSVIQTCT